MYLLTNRRWPANAGIITLVLPLLLVCRCVAEQPVKIYWSKATESYEFDTGQLFGCIEPYSWYHGIAGLVHHEYMVNVVRPKNAFLNAEYYRKLDAERSMLPRKLSIEKKTTHELRDGKVLVRFPSEPIYGISLELTYRPHGDAIDLQAMVTPSQDVSDFGLFFASYVGEDFQETWVPLRNESGKQQWKKLDNRKNNGETFHVLPEGSKIKPSADERPKRGQRERSPQEYEKLPFSKSILIARNPDNGMALVFFCDPERTNSLDGQYHVWDTAHDWWYGADLAAGQPMRTSSRLIYRRFPNTQSMFDEVETEWGQFVNEFQRR